MQGASSVFLYLRDWFVSEFVAILEKVTWVLSRRFILVGFGEMLCILGDHLVYNIAPAFVWFLSG